MAVVLRQFPRSYLGELNHAVWRSAAYIGLFTQQLWQFRNVRSNPSRLTSSEQRHAIGTAGLLALHLCRLFQA